LERQQQSNPQSAAVNRALGIAYYKAERYPDARAALETAARLEPKDGTTALYLGLTAEAQNDFPAAKRAYSSYIEFGRTSRVRGQLQSRLAALARKELLAEAKHAVAQEAALAGQAGSPSTVAVMPLRFSGADSTLQPLERGFADMLTTDLARSSQLTLVERARLQALLDEMTLQKTGATDASTSARAGRLVRAGRVVQGSLLQVGGDNTQLRVDAAIIDVPTTQVSGTAQSTDVLAQVFDLEKRLALDLFRELGVTLTPAERTAMEQRPTRSLAAFLAYSRGLAEEDAGNYDAASRYFNDAARIDPGFGAAQQHGQQSQSAATGSQVSSRTVETALRGSNEEKIVAAATQGGSAPAEGIGGLGATAGSTANDLNNSTAGNATVGGAVTTGVTLPGSVTGTAPQVQTNAGVVVIQIARPKP
jgi:Tetratricopeptide repeat./Curli production assembly/transport component CsgG.